MKQRNETLTSLFSPVRLFLTVLAIVFLSETAVMVLLPVLAPGLNDLGASLVDSAMVVCIIAPFLWWLVIRPLRSTAMTEHVRAATILSSASDGIVTLNEQGLVESFNAAAECIFGYGAAEVMGKPITPLIPERCRDEYRGGLERACSMVTSDVAGQAIELHGLRKDGSEFPVELSLATWHRGDETCYIGIVRDITERKRMEQRLEELYGLGLTMQEPLTLSECLALVLKSAQSVLGFDRINILLSDPGGKVLRAAAVLGSEEPLERIQVPLGPEGGGIAKAFLEHKEIVWEGTGPVPNEWRLARPYAEIAALRSQAFVIVPLIVRGTAIGVMEADNKFSRKPIAAETVRFLRTFAAQAAVAIDNARLYTAVQERAERIAAVNRLTRIINSSLDLDSIYKAFATEVKQLIRCDRMGIVIPDESGKGLQILKLSSDQPGTSAAGNVWSKREGTGIDWVMSERRPHIEPDLAEARLFIEDEFLLREGLRSSIRLPLIAKGQVIGALFLDSSEPGCYSGRDLELLVPLGQQLALAIENARLYSALDDSRRQLEKLHGLGLAMQEPMALSERLDLILNGAQTVLGFDRINVLLSNAEGTMLRAVASVGGDEPLERIRVPLGPEGGGIAKAFLERKDIVWDGAGPVPDEWRLAAPYSDIIAFRSRAFVNVPLIVRGEPIGVLGADNRSSRKPITAETIRLLKAFAAQAAVAIDNARLYDEVSGYAKGLEQKVEERTRVLKETQAQLIQSGKLAAVGTLAAGVAHELNQPLMVIRGYAQELLEDGRITDAEIREDLVRIEAQTSRMVAIITHLRDFSRQSKGKRQATDLNRVVTHAFTFLDQQLKARNLTVVQALDPGLPPVWADPLQIEQVLLNLVTNARDAMEAAGMGTIAVRTGVAQDGRVALTVTDSGPGIPPDLQARIFDPFFTTKEVGKGTGLGLSICHGIMEEHGGELRVESPVANNRGARFTVLLPLSLRDSSGRDHK